MDEPPPARVPSEVLDPPRVLSVSELTSLLKGTLEGRFPRVTVSGEVSNFRTPEKLQATSTSPSRTKGPASRPWSGRRDALRLPYDLADGLQLICQGRIEVYAPHGKYQLIAERLEPVGAGALALAFEQLERRSWRWRASFIPRASGPSHSCRAASGW